VVYAGDESTPAPVDGRRARRSRTAAETSALAERLLAAIENGPAEEREARLACVLDEGA
jgi:hypothetical protein